MIGPECGVAAMVTASLLHPTSSAEARPVYGREEADPVFRPA